uniref:hypothetical protein n=1 Tax=Streptomyces polyasparticus TaxID=2767826 RepID=UPI001F17EECD|nr:hypothetical protein [Streptomyces polyasparticus]
MARAPARHTHVRGLLTLRHRFETVPHPQTSPLVALRDARGKVYESSMGGRRPGDGSPLIDHLAKGIAQGSSPIADRQLWKSKDLLGPGADPDSGRGTAAPHAAHVRGWRGAAGGCA